MMKQTIYSAGLALLFLTPIAVGATTSQADSPDDWKVKVDLGASIASGNTDTTLVTAGFRADRKVSKDIYSLGASFAWGEEDGDTTSQSVLADASWNYARTERTLSLIHI